MAISTFSVSFDVIKDVPDVQPPFKAGTRDHVYVRINTENTNPRTAAKEKIELCYGKGIAKNFKSTYCW